MQGELVPTQGQILLLWFLAVGKDANHGNSLLQCRRDLDAFQCPFEFRLVCTSTTTGAYRTRCHRGSSRAVAPDQRGPSGGRKRLLGSRRLGAAHNIRFHVFDLFELEFKLDFRPDAVRIQSDCCLAARTLLRAGARESLDGRWICTPFSFSSSIRSPPI